MGKQTSKLDRKTRRAIAHAIRHQVNSSNKAGNGYTKRASSSTSFSVSSQGLTGWNTTASAGSSIKSGGKALPVLRELPPIVGTLHVSHYTSDELHWHLKVAEKMVDIDWTFVCRTTDSHEVSMDQMAFYSEGDKQAFEAWMTKYLEKFGGHSDLMLPAPLDGDFPHIVRSNFNRTRAASNSFNSQSASSGDDDSFEQKLEQWLWILDNCEGEVRHAGTFWFFADKGDAALFKIAYS